MKESKKLQNQMESFWKLKDGEAFDENAYRRCVWDLRQNVNHGLQRYMTFVPADWVYYGISGLSADVVLDVRKIPMDKQFGFRALRLIPVTTFRHTLLNVLLSHWSCPEVCLFVDLKDVSFVDKFAYYAGKSGDGLYQPGGELQEAVWNVDDWSKTGLDDRLTKQDGRLSVGAYGFSGFIRDIGNVLCKDLRCENRLLSTGWDVFSLSVDRTVLDVLKAAVRLQVHHDFAEKISRLQMNVDVVRESVQEMWKLYVCTVVPYMLSYFSDGKHYEYEVPSSDVVKCLNRYRLAFAGTDWACVHLMMLVSVQWRFDSWLTQGCSKERWDGLYERVLSEFDLNTWDSTWSFRE